MRKIATSLQQYDDDGGLHKVWHDDTELPGVSLHVRLTVCPIRAPHAAAWGLLLWARPAGQCCTAGGQQQPRGSSSVWRPDAGSDALSADAGS